MEVEKIIRIVFKNLVVDFEYFELSLFFSRIRRRNVRSVYVIMGDYESRFLVKEFIE